jgi:hypothetical protein
MSGTGHVAGMGDRGGAYKILFGKNDRRNCLEDLGVNGRKIIKYIFKKWDEGHELD